MFAIWNKLHKLGVVGLNARNHSYVMKYNRRASYPLVDDKLLTKKLAIEAGIAVPRLYGAVATQHDLAKLSEILGTHKEFVIKPAHGAGGEGVLVIDGKRKELYVKPDGRALSLDEIKYHASNILSGIYSLGGIPDSAMIEYRVRVNPILDPISYRGVPDVRLLVFRGVPAMAMIRLPTRYSDGKANLHQGAVGVGIEIATGITCDGVFQNRVVQEHPDFGVALAGLQIPEWDNMLELGARCYDLTGLGYMGVDIVLDRVRGPMILEINARPGLAIQIANQSGLQGRLDKIEALEEIPSDPKARALLAVELFPGERVAVSALSLAPAEEAATENAEPDGSPTEP